MLLTDVSRAAVSPRVKVALFFFLSRFFLLLLFLYFVFLLSFSFFCIFVYTSDMMPKPGLWPRSRSSAKVLKLKPKPKPVFLEGHEAKAEANVLKGHEAEAEAKVSVLGRVMKPKPKLAVKEHHETNAEAIAKINIHKAIYIFYEGNNQLCATLSHLCICVPWLFPPVWGVADNTKETTKAMGISLHSSNNDEGPSRVWMALLEQHSPSSPVFHNLRRFIDAISSTTPTTGLPL